jgi:RNA polymerase sigma factor FliA
MTSPRSAAESLTPSQQNLLNDHLPIVQYMVSDLLRRVPSYIQRDDLTSAAMLGLLQAVRAFDPTREAKFSTFARVRIQGALLDELRSRDWASRGVRQAAKEVDMETERLSNVLGRTPTTQELSASLGGTDGQIHRLKADVHRATVLSFDGAPVDAQRTPLDVLAIHHDYLDPAEQMEQRELTAYVRDAVANLPERLRRVVVGYFLEERPMAELALELGVTESRISHMRAEALALMAEAIKSATADEKPCVPPADTGVASRRRSAYYAAVAATSDYRSRLVQTPVGSGTPMAMKRQALG